MNHSFDQYGWPGVLCSHAHTSKSRMDLVSNFSHLRYNSGTAQWTYPSRLFKISKTDITNRCLSKITEVRKKIIIKSTGMEMNILLKELRFAYSKKPLTFLRKYRFWIILQYWIKINFTNIFIYTVWWTSADLKFKRTVQAFENSS